MIELFVDNLAFLPALGAVTGTGGGLMSSLGGLFGGFANAAEVARTRKDIRRNGRFTDQTGNFGFGSAFAGANGQNSFQFGPEQQLMNMMLQAGSLGQLGGGLFNDQNFQNAFQGNDIAGALGQSNNAFAQQASGSAFGGLGGLFNQNQGLSSLFANQAAAGPQDLTGGLQGSLFGQGFANQQAALDQSGLEQRFLDTQRQRATQGGLLDRAINRFENNQFAQGRLGTTGGAEQTSGFLDSIARQDLDFQNNAFGLGQQQQQFLGNLGSQQIGQGAGLLGQNLGQFNQQAQLANLFGNSAAGIEGQQFGQNLGALQQNQSAGQQRLAQALGLFGQGAGLFNDSFAQGLAGFQGGLAANQQALDATLGLREAENSRISATGQHSRALADVQGSSGGILGGAIGGLFSDARLKDNVTKIGTLGDHNWYEWEWNDEAKAVGADKQPNYGVIAQEILPDFPAAVSIDQGYLKVNYSMIVGV